MADRIALQARPRTVLGKKVRSLRRQGVLPATVYGHNVAPQSIEIDAREFRAVHHTAGDTQLIDLVVDGGRPRPVLIHGTQVDPRRNAVIHVEFFQANLLEKVIAHVPVQFVGESPVVGHDAMLLPMIESVTVEALPTDLPQFVEADISGLASVNDQLHVSDLRLDRSKIDVKIDETEVVATIQPVRAVAEEVPEVAAEAGTGAAASGDDAAPASDESAAEG